MANSSIIPRSWLRNGWTHWHLFGGLFLVLTSIFVSHEAWLDMYNIGSDDPEESHIFLAPIVAIWVAWVRRKRLRDLTPGNPALGLVFIALGTVAYIIGDTYQIQALWHGGSVILLEGSFLAIVGPRMLVAFLPAFIAMLFAIPVPGLLRLQISLPLQTLSAEATQAVMDTLGWSVNRSGNVLQVNGIDLAIAEACNGLRMVFALLIVSYAFAFTNPLRWYVRAIILGLSPVLALGANVVRLTMTAWAYGTTTHDHAQFFHDASGWVMLPLAFVTLSGVVRILQWAMVPVQRYAVLLNES